VALTPEEARALVKKLAEEARTAKKKKRLEWRPPTRKELEQRRANLGEVKP